ncbi:sulfite exporter TauE/SafE family protein [Seohaeicola zhoushanensis]|uniref:sulfite exporter TauE/SafE family protein n=1 Tax=Seohaeicola zhoushanensis TaxID=1569283 RepID=UPI001E4F30FE|nr:sulfite exporter TauE/SafE family protein [Seohaeicola zhoushanensis]
MAPRRAATCRSASAADVLGLSPYELAYVMAAVFCAGVVRGFSGFALSALIMASCVLILPPVVLIPVCTLLELAASAMLMRGGLGEADRGMVLRLHGAAALGIPAGLALTTSVDPNVSALIALCLVSGLATLQLARVQLPARGCATTLGVGLMAGLATGLASIGGMVIVLYVLALNMPARMARASMIFSVFLGGSLSLFWQFAFGMTNWLALQRALVLLLPCLAGIWVGRALFVPAYERHYRRFCLSLLLALAAIGIVQRIAAR